MVAEPNATSAAVDQDNTVDKDEMLAALRQMVEGLIDHVRSRSYTEGDPRDRLDELSERLRNANTPEGLREISNELAAACITVGDAAEAVVDDLLRERQDEIKKVVTSMSEGVEALSSIQGNFKEAIGEEISKIESISETDDPEVVGEKLRNASSSLLNVTEKAKEEIEVASTSIEDATLRIKELEQELERTRQEGLRDGLTRLFNRRAFDAMMSETLRGTGISKPCSLVMLDVDHFKKVNDEHGHLIGDALLMKVARIVKSSVGRNSFAARYGGEEFCVIVASSSLTKARDVAEDIRSRVRMARWGYSNKGERRQLSTAVSLGVAQFRDGDTAQSVISRADKALYLAKGSGRDQVRTEREIE